jgi:hypothetical protein
VVLDVLADEIDHPAARCLDFPSVDHRAGAGGLVEPQAAGEEIAVRQVQAGCSETGDIDYGALADRDSVGVDQEDPAVRVHLAEDGRRCVPRDAIQDTALGRLLEKPDNFLTGDAETLPIDDGAVRISDGKDVAVYVYGDRALDDGGIGWQGIACLCDETRSHGERQQLAFPPGTRFTDLPLHPRPPRYYCVSLKG